MVFKKNPQSVICRYGYPRELCTETHIDSDGKLVLIADIMLTAKQKLYDFATDSDSKSTQILTRKFLTKTVNLMEGRREVSSQTCINDLLELPDEICSKKTWIHLNYGILIREFNILNTDHIDPTEKRIHLGRSLATQSGIQDEHEDESSVLVDYCCRGPNLKDLSLYFYKTYIYKKNRKGLKVEGIPFTGTVLSLETDYDNFIVI